MLSLEDAAALSTWPGVRRARLAQFLHAIGPSADVTREAALAGECLAPTLDAALEYSGVPAQAIAAELRASGRQALDLAAATGCVPIPWGDPRYPPLLASIHDPPVVLWARGRLDVLSGPAVAIVGSRAASPSGLEAATGLAADLAARGAIVVSGLARGIDSAAHEGALQAGGVTIAVLGSGTDVIYPPEHRALADRVTGSGAVVSELPPGTQPRPLHFPARNRIISGLSLAVVVIEAAERSGSLITAEFAIEQGREVLAVPGSIVTGRYRGCHALIRDGAGLVEDADDVVSALRGNPFGAAAEPNGRDPSPLALLDRMAAGDAYDVDSLAQASGLAAPALLSSLLELELQGRVRRVEGTRFVRVIRTC